MKKSLVVLLVLLLVGCGKHSQSSENPEPPAAADAEFSFAVLADRTGDERPGAFRKALGMVEKRRPDLVLSVGDLIQGYSENEAELDRQWDELDKMLETLTMPFYYVPGNHDLTNALMARKWQQRYGEPNKAFVHKNVLFLCLNTQQPYGIEINKRQADFVQKALEDHPDVRWTFVFFHHPWWNYADAAWQKIEKMLADRPHTIFAGHYHQYLKENRNGTSYYILATTGGTSSMRGPAYGEFDHFVWVTMKGGRPQISNVLLDGTVLGPNIRTPETAALVDSVAKGVGVQPTAFVAAQPRFSQIKSSIALRNSAAVPMTFSGEFRKHPNLIITPPKFELSVLPGEQKEMPLELKNSQAIDVADVPPVELNWLARWPLNDQAGDNKYRYRQPLEMTGTRRFEVDARYPCLLANQLPKIDGSLDEWGTLPIVCTKPAQFLFTRSSWKGSDDCSFRFAVRHDAEGVYLAIGVTDDLVVSQPGYGPNFQDGIELYLDARPQADIAADTSIKRQKAGQKPHYLLLQLSPGEDAAQSVIANRNDLPPGVQAACVTTAGGYAAEIAIPASYLNEKQGTDWQHFRLNIAVSDFDGKPGDGANAVQIWWRPDWRRDRDYAEAGYFEKNR